MTQKTLQSYVPAADQTYSEEVNVVLTVTSSSGLIQVMSTWMCQDRFLKVGAGRVAFPLT